MDFRLTEEQEILKKSVADFVDAEVAPIAAELDEKGEFPHDLFRRMGEMGYYGLRYPESYGGSGLDSLTYCVMIEEIARGSLSVAATCAMQSLMGTYFVFRFGTEEQKQRLLVSALRGEKLGTFGMTEANAGSDISAMETTAVRDGEDYVLNGSKMWLTSGTVADFFTIAAVTDKQKGADGFSLFLIEKGTPGFNVGKKIDKLGVRASETTELSLDDCHVPAGNLLGEENAGYDCLKEILCEIRTMTGALSLGLARAALAEALRYSQERKQFGKPIGRFQAIQFKLAEMATRIESARHLVNHAAWLADNGLPNTKQAAMAKLVASEAAVFVADEASRIFASYGFAMEYPVQRYLRDARFLLIGGGTSEILNVIIAKEIGA